MGATGAGREVPVKIFEGTELGDFGAFLASTGQGWRSRWAFDVAPRRRRLVGLALFDFSYAL